MNYDGVIQEKRLCAKRGGGKKLNILIGEHKKPFPLSLLPGIPGLSFPASEVKDPSANMFCSSATGSSCDVSAASPDIAPAGPAASSDILRDLFSRTDADKSPNKSGPQIPWPLIKVIRPWSAISNRR